MTKMFKIFVPNKDVYIYSGHYFATEAGNIYAIIKWLNDNENKDCYLLDDYGFKYEKTDDPHTLKCTHID